MIEKPQDLEEWVKTMRRLGVRTLTTKGVGIELDPLAPEPLPDPFEEVDAGEPEKLPGMCRKCGQEQPNSLLPGVCRACAGKEWSESLQ